MYVDQSLKLIRKLTVDPLTTLADAYARTEAHIMKTEPLKAVVSNRKSNEDFIQPKKKQGKF